MSFQLPSVKPKGTAENKLSFPVGQYGLPDPMIYGLNAGKQVGPPAHPLELSEKLYAENRLKMDMQLMKNTQGIHAPLRLAMELRAAKKVGHLPFLPSSNLMSDVLLGRDDEIGFEDVLNTPEFSEQLMNPHLVLENRLDW